MLDSFSSAKAFISSAIDLLISDLFIIIPVLILKNFIRKKTLLRSQKPERVGSVTRIT